MVENKQGGMVHHRILRATILSDSGNKQNEKKNKDLESSDSSPGELYSQGRVQIPVHWLWLSCRLREAKSAVMESSQCATEALLARHQS